MRSFFFPAVLAVSLSALAAGAERKEAVISMAYTGNRKLDFPPLADRVRIQVKQVPILIASRWGLLQYQDGFQYPLTIRFVDKVRLSDEEFEPRDLENAPALLRFMPDRDGVYHQDLDLNANVYFERPREFDRVLDRQLAFVVLNEAMGPDSLDLPHWVRQGLATYAAGTGDEILQRAARAEIEDARADQRASPGQPFRVGRPHSFVQELDARFSWRAQAQYYLAIRFIEKQGGVGGLQNFVRNIVGGKSVSDSLDQAISMDLDEFKRNLRDYSNKVFDDLTRT